MSLRTPSLMTSPEIWAMAGAVSARTAATAIIAIFMCIPFSSNPEILVQLVEVLGEILVADHVDDAAVLDDVVAIGEGRREVKVLLDEKDRKALLLQGADDRADLLNDDRGKALGRLVEQQQGGAGPQDPADRQHLLLAAGQLGALAAPPLLEVGKDRVDFSYRHAAGRHHWRQQQVLLDIKAGKDAALLRAIGDAEPRDPVRGEPGKLGAAEGDRAPPLRNDPHDRSQGRRLAGAVAPEQG